jgi:hypothetical protein
VKVHLPLTVATKPYSRDVRVAGQCSGAAGWCLRSVIHDGGDVWRQEDDVGIKKPNGNKGTMLMELPDEGENFIPAPYLC